MIVSKHWKQNNFFCNCLQRCLWTIEKWSVHPFCRNQTYDVSLVQILWPKLDIGNISSWDDWSVPSSPAKPVIKDVKKVPLTVFSLFTNHNAEDWLLKWYFQYEQMYFIISKDNALFISTGTQIESLLCVSVVPGCRHQWIIRQEPMTR